MNGGKANEVSLTWDGITVSNPMLGLNDFSLITTGPEYKIQIADMTSASVLGAGAIAGAVLIDPVWNKNTFSTSVNLAASSRSEEHTSELQSRGHLVCRRVLEDKKS